MNEKEFLEWCKQEVCDYTNKHLDKTDKKEIITDDVYMVWCCKTLQNNKALLSTTLPDGIYYECTYNGDKKEMYVDVYKKLIMNLQLFGLGQVSRPFLNADSGEGNGGAGTGADNSNGEGRTDENQNSDEGDKSFDDILKDKKYQSEFDKRVAKALETARGKWETDYQAKVEEAKTEAEKLAKMNAEQKAKYAEEKRVAELEKREKDITTRELRATAFETLAEKNLPKELVDILNYSDAEQCNKSIEAVEKAFQTAVERAVNEKLRGKQTPNKGGQGNAEDAALRKAMGL